MDGGAVRLIPVGGYSTLPRINRAVRLIEETLSWCDFFLIRDRDYLTAEMIRKYEPQEGGRFFVLERHQIENYLLNDAHIAEVEAELFDRKVTAEGVLGDLRICARRVAGEVLRDMTTIRSLSIAIPIRADLRSWNNGPTLVHGIQNLHGRRIHLPSRPGDRPDRDRLSVRYDAFLEEAGKAR